MFLFERQCSLLIYVFSLSGEGTKVLHDFVTKKEVLRVARGLGRLESGLRVQ